MGKLNQAVKRKPIYTAEGAPASHISVKYQLRRSVLSCLLWEDGFYESGQEIAKRIEELALQSKPADLAALAIEAREVQNLRHVPLLLLDALSRIGQGNSLVAETVARVIQRADEPGELLSVLWRNGRKMIPNQMRKGLQRALTKFSEYHFAKYDRDGAVKLRDVFRLVRPKPETEEQSALWKRVKDRTLATPDTWEVALSAGADKKETFTRLLLEGQLGYLALLRNLRNMAESGVDPILVKQSIIARKGSSRVLPFRYVAAARAAMQFEAAIDQALCEAISEMPPLKGLTIVLVDVSGSMNEKLSGKSDMKRMDAAAALGAIIPGDVRVFTFSGLLVEVPPRRGMAGVDAIIRSQQHGGTNLGAALAALTPIRCERMIVITDEQSHDSVVSPSTLWDHAYMVNVASNKNGVGYGSWVHLDGFSEGIIRWIAEIENDFSRAD